jgi:hypothetical protein
MCKCLHNIWHKSLCGNDIMRDASRVLWYLCRSLCANVYITFDTNIYVKMTLWVTRHAFIGSYVNAYVHRYLHKSLCKNKNPYVKLYVNLKNRPCHTFYSIYVNAYVYLCLHKSLCKTGVLKPRVYITFDIKIFSETWHISIT